MNRTSQDTRCWDHFWASGQSSCCSESGLRENDQAIREQWEAMFSVLAPNQHVLDICTGNGAVLRVALECSVREAVPVDLVGVDAAAITPDEDNFPDGGHVPLFVRGDAAELPFADSAFDMVVSQFGMEYLPLEPAIGEAMRVLKEDGRGRFIAHAVNGATTLGAAAELGDIDLLLDDIAVFPAASEAIRLTCNAERNRSGVSAKSIERAREAHRIFHDRLQRIADELPRRAAAGVYRSTGSILQHTFLNRAHFPVEVLLDKVRESEESVRMHRERLRSLVESAFDRQACEYFVSQCLRLGADNGEFAEIVAADGSRQLGWVITIRN